VAINGRCQLTVLLRRNQALLPFRLYSYRSVCSSFGPGAMLSSVAVVGADCEAAT
jgi:hypothetical protein